MKLALLAGGSHADATYRAVLGGLGAALTRRGHRVALAGRPAPTGAAAFRGAPPFPVVSFGRGGASRAAEVADARAAERVLPRLLGGCDVAHLHFSGFARPWMDVLARAARGGLVLTFQDWAHPALPAPDAAGKRALERLARASAAVSAVSRALARALEDDLPFLRGRVRVLPNGADPGPRTRRARGNYVLSIGRQAPYKGTDLLLAAFAMLPPGPRLVLCGAAHRPAAVRGLVRRLGLSGRVRLAGLLPPARVRALLDGCLFHVSAARAESFGLANLEALARGRAAVAADVGGVRDYLRHGVNGLLVPARDPAALAAAMRRLLDDPALAERLGRRGAAGAAAFSWDAVARRAEALYGVAAAARRSTSSAGR